MLLEGMEGEGRVLSEAGGARNSVSSGGKSVLHGGGGEVDR